MCPLSHVYMVLDSAVCPLFFWLIYIYIEDVYNASLKDSRFCIAFRFCNGCSLVSLWLCLCMCKQETNLFSQFQFSGIEG